MDALRFGRGRLVNSVAIARNIIAERVEVISTHGSVSFLFVFIFPRL